MTSQELYKLRFPIGEFEFPTEVSTELKEKWIQSISDFPKTISSLTSDLSTEDKNRRYRPGGWTIKQVVHHCVDSHINSIIRFKFALTEDSPTIKPYLEDRWAELSDGQDEDLTDSLQLLTALHSKWVKLLRNLTENDLKRVYIHPDHAKHITLLDAISLYAWHCEHHLGHVKLALKN